MDKKTFIKTDTSGKILAVVTSNDPTLVFDETEIITDITKDKNRDKLVENSKHFKFKSKKVSEMTATEKKKVDDDEKSNQPINPVWEAVQKINDRLDVIEKNLKIKVKG